MTAAASARTAIHRTKLSSPCKWLHEQGRLVGRVLDYGCSHGFDCGTLGLEGYDPAFRPVLPPGQFDTVVCLYVLNVIESAQERFDVLLHVWDILAEGGTGYFAVRADITRPGWTGRGTWQGDIRLPLPVLRRTNHYRLYSMRKERK